MEIPQCSQPGSRFWCLSYTRNIFFQLSYLNVPYCSSRSFCRDGEEILLFIAAASTYLFKELLLFFQVFCKLNTIHSSLNIFPRIMPRSRICSVEGITALTERLIWSTLITALNYACLFWQIAGMPPMIVIPKWKEQKLCRISRAFCLLFCGCYRRILLTWYFCATLYHYSGYCIAVTSFLCNVEKQRLEIQTYINCINYINLGNFVIETM